MCIRSFHGPEPRPGNPLIAMKKTLLLPILIAIASGASAAEDYTHFDMTSGGLSNNYVTGIAQDRSGFVWVATEAGLNRFDGSTFDVFRKCAGGPNSNLYNRIHLDSSRNVLWLCFQREGLDALDCDTHTFTHYGNAASGGPLAGNGVTDVAEGPDGCLWVCTYTAGLDLLDPRTDTALHFNTSTTASWPDDKVWTATPAPGGHEVYVGHVDAGFSILNPKTGTLRNFRNDGTPGCLPGNAVRSILADAAGRIWVGTDGGLALFNRDTQSFTTFGHDPADASSLISNNVNHIAMSRDGHLWISTENGGISILDPDSATGRNVGKAVFVNLSSDVLSNKTARICFQDSFGNMWIGTCGDGLDVVPHRNRPVRRIHSRSRPLSTSINTVMALYAGGDTVIAGTDGAGADLMLRSKGILGQSILPGEAVLAITKGPGGEMWYGTYSGIVAADRGKGPERIHIPGCLDVRCFAPMPDGSMLVGCGAGIARINPDGKVSTHYASEGRLREQWLRSILVRPDGDIWVGSFGNGISIYDSNLRPKGHIDYSNGLRSATVNHLVADGNGVWAATAEGLARISPEGRVDSLYLNDYFDSDVRALALDSDGNLWMSTASGITMRDAGGRFLTFGDGDGISGGDFSAACVAQTPEGKIMFGSHDGIYTFTPGQMSSTQETPRPMFTEVTVFGNRDEKTVLSAPETEMRLPHDHNTLRIHFNVPDAALADMIDWTYCVEGLDNRFYPSDDRTGVILRNLPPGKYRFKVRASVRNGKPAVSEAVLPFVITPPLWATWWAKLGYVLLIICGGFIGLRFYRKRLDLEYALDNERRNNRQQELLNAERMRFFTNITHELRTPLTLILGPLSDLKSDTTLAAPHGRRIALIHKSATRLLELINTILEFRKTETQNRRLRVRHGDIAPLVAETGARYSELNTNPSLKVETIIEQGDFAIWYDREVLSMIIDNLMSNACKYTVDGRVVLSLYHSNESGVRFVEIAVSDTGLGMDSETLQHIFDRYYRDIGSETRLGTGIGLALVYNLVSLHQGEIFAESEPGRGSTFRFRLHATASYPEAERHTLPVADETAEETTPPATNHDAETCEPNVLAVDDNIDILNYMRESLAEHYRVECATDGASGLEIASRTIPDIIVTDVMMPRLDGIGMIRKLKDNPETSHIPVIVVTAKIAEEARVEAYSAGADSFITKPFSSTLLRSRIKNILDARHALAAGEITPEQASEQAPLVSEMSRTDAEFLGRVEDIVMKHIDSDKLDVGFIADAMCMSHSTLYRKVKGITGLSVARLVRRYRARKAAELLGSGKYTVSEIAFMLGMGSLANFRQCFRDEFGISPSEYLRNPALRPKAPTSGNGLKETGDTPDGPES